jgi:hypothetical protein
LSSHQIYLFYVLIDVFFTSGQLSASTFTVGKMDYVSNETKLPLYLSEFILRLQLRVAEITNNNIAIITVIITNIVSGNFSTCIIFLL